MRLEKLTKKHIAEWRQKNRPRRTKAPASR
jgi:hypothetical protein